MDMSIKWNNKKIKEYTQSNKKLFKYSVDYNYLAEHFTEIYTTCLKDGILIPDLCESIYYLTTDGQKAIDKIKKPEITQKAINNIAESIDKRNKMIYNTENNEEKRLELLSQELVEFIKKYPQWTKLVLYEINWDKEKINTLTKENKETKINYNYLAKHFKEIYLTTLQDGILLPELFESIEYCTTDNTNALETIIIPELPENTREKLSKKRMERMLKLSTKSQEEIKNKLNKEVKEFTEKYPQWKEILNT